MVCLVPSSSILGRTSESRGEDTNHFFIDDTWSLRPTLAPGDDSKAPDQAVYGVPLYSASHIWRYTTLYYTILY